MIVKSYSILPNYSSFNVLPESFIDLEKKIMNMDMN